jgi:pantoate--beta-alanine ligase
VFGRKDYQQLKIIERMASDLLFDVEVVGLRTVRDADGLALSSRNAYLSAAERERARAIPRALSAAVAAFQAGERRAGPLRDVVQRKIAESATKVDYVSIADPDTLAPVDDVATVGRTALLAVAAWIEKTRLIDNVVLGDDSAPIERDR